MALAAGTVIDAGGPDFGPGLEAGQPDWRHRRSTGKPGENPRRESGKGRWRSPRSRSGPDGVTPLKREKATEKTWPRRANSLTPSTRPSFEFAPALGRRPAAGQI